MLKILIAEDEAHNRDALVELLTRMGHKVTPAQDGREALAILQRERFDVVLSDVRMPTLDGMQFFDAAKSLGLSAPFIFMTAYGRLDEAVSAMKRGALHFLTKPLRKKDLSVVLDEVTALTKAPAEMAAAASPVWASRGFSSLVETVEKVAPSLASILIAGESGAGKEIVARMIHAKSARATGPFVAFHAGALPESLVESELFGCVKGAFTGADADRLGLIRSAQGGTFFIDELASMPLSTQVKLLRVIQDRQVTPVGSTQAIDVDVRWVAATNQPLMRLVEQGRFREDLLYRLSVVGIEVPPLRERPEDVIALAESFATEFAARESKPALEIPSETRDLLLGHSWPGNVRELRNVIERATVLASGQRLTPELLPQHISGSERSKEIRVAVGTPLDAVTDKLIEETLKVCDGDKNKTALMLGVSPRSIYRWLEKRV